MKVMAVSVAEMAKSGQVLSAAYYADREQGETYRQWQQRTARARAVASAQHRIARLGGVGDHEPSCVCHGSGLIDGGTQLEVCRG